MHGVLQRVNQLMSVTLTVLAVLVCLCALSSALLKFDDVPSVVKTNRLRLMNVADFTTDSRPKDLGAITFDLKVNFSQVFNWNVKQLFVYVTAEYETETNALNQVVIWDKVILNGDNPIIDMENVSSEYYFFDDGNGLVSNKNLSLYLSWNMVPNAGPLTDHSAPDRCRFKFPDKYHSSRQ
ncbi:signal peptidase [Nesidiocoris tenuis]|uniref:Signal peptidase complex subunit 3 n=2 Tax=Nesidiocoris tenuis TaxID=355587 RepID=A0ABN7B1K8_9HEMI|nr:signal peptidase [Nesidiocoris tenuis]